jgi:hypothetical protein
MKKLQKEFTGNYDQVGVTRFVQVKRTNEVAMYRRERMDGTFKSFEVFIVKTRKKGDPLPNGAVEKEDRECYAGTSQFGKTAYDCKTESQAEQRFDELLLKSKNQSEAKEEAAKTGIRNRGRRGTGNKVKLDMTLNKGTKFTARFLMSALGVTQPVLFPILKQWEKEGSIKVSGSVKGEGKGRPATEYIVV